MQYQSKVRVERDGFLVYAEGDDIPETDVAELEAQGHIKRAKMEAPKANKVELPAANKTRARKKA